MTSRTFTMITKILAVASSSTLLSYNNNYDLSSYRINCLESINEFYNTMQYKFDAYLPNTKSSFQ